jgi:hypothetical protein
MQFCLNEPKMTDTKPKRRWFRFSLRTLFVMVTIIGVAAGWAGYQLNWIRQRHAFISNSPPKIVGLVAGRNDPTFKSPWTLNLFGEEPIRKLLGVQEQYVSEAKALFPEATINPPNIRLRKPPDFGPTPPSPKRGPDATGMSTELRQLFPATQP